MDYMVLTIAIIIGWFCKGFGSRHKKLIVEIIGWVLMAVSAIIMVVMKFGFKL